MWSFYFWGRSKLFSLAGLSYTNKTYYKINNGFVNSQKEGFITGNLGLGYLHFFNSKNRVQISSKIDIGKLKVLSFDTKYLYRIHRRWVLNVIGQVEDISYSLNDSDVELTKLKFGLGLSFYLNI